MNIEVNWEVDPEDVGCGDYEGYRVTSINVNDDTKEIWSINYSYIWDCGDGCCSNTETDIAYVGEIAQWLKDRILEKLPDHKLQS